MNSRNIRAGGAFIELFVRDGLQKGLDKAAARMKAFGAGIAGVGVGAIGVGSTMASPFFTAIGAASDMQETMNKFDVVFAERSKEVKDWGDAFADEVGRSKKQIADFMSGSQDLFVPLGFDSGAAEEMSKQVTGLSIDLASFNNMADGDTLRDLHAALTGSGEVMKKYGVVLDEAATKQELLNQGLDPKTATNAQKAQARWAIILRGTTSAQGDAVRSAGAYANQMKALDAQIDNAKVSLGQAVLPMVTQFVTHVVTAAKITGQWIEQNQGLVRIFAAVAVGLIAGGSALLVFGTLIMGAGMAVSAFSTLLGVAGTVLGALVGAITAVVSPVGIVIALVLAAGAALIYFSGIGGTVVSFLTDRFGQLWNWVSTVFAGIAAAIQAGDIAGAANILWLALQVAWTAGVGKLSQLWMMFKNTSLRVFDELRFGVVRIFAAMLDKIGGLVRAAGDFLGLESLQNAAEAIDQFSKDAGTGAQIAIDQRAAARQKAADAQLAKMQSDLKQAQAELDGAVASAQTQTAELQDAKKSAAATYAPPEISGGAGSAAAAVVGTFSGAAAARFSGVASALDKRTAEASEKTAENTKTMSERLAKLQMPQFT